MAIKYNMYGSPQIYGAPQVQAGKDRKYKQAYDARVLENKNAMDLLLKAYTANIEKNRVVTATREVGMKNDIYDEFFADTANIKITRRETTGNDLLLGAQTAEELLQIAGVKKPTVKNQQAAYNTQLTAATGLINQAKASNKLGGNTMFDINNSNSVTKTTAAQTTAAAAPITYSFDKYASGINDALTKKYSALGELQRGGLQNQTATTADDEAVLFKTNAAYSVQSEFDALSKNFKGTTDQINTEFTKYNQDQKRIGMYQTASLSEDQMYKKIISDIESSYTTFNSKKEKGYVGDTYMNPSVVNKNTTRTDYIKTLPTIITP